jgi:hypothetical protein
MKNGPYELVVAPEEYPGIKYRGRYIYEHHLVWWRNTGELVTGSMLIHHRNEQKRDNRFENLEKKDKAVHASEHTRKRVGPRKMLTLECAWCGKDFQIAASDWPSRSKYVNNHCSRSCSVKNQMFLAGNVHL